MVGKEEVAESLSSEETSQLGVVMPPDRLLPINKIALAGAKNWLLGSFSNLEGYILIGFGREGSVLWSTADVEVVEEFQGLSEVLGQEVPSPRAYVLPDIFLWLGDLSSYGSRPDLVRSRANV